MVDPFITGNPLYKDKLDVKSLKADYILLTHAHQDHTLDVETIAKNTNAKIADATACCYSAYITKPIVRWILH